MLENTSNCKIFNEIFCCIEALVMTKGKLRMKLFFLRNKNLIVTWLFSYILIILIMLFVTVFVGTVYEKTIYKETLEFNNYVLDSVASNVNDTLLNINNCYLNVIGNEELKDYVSGGGENDYSTEEFYRAVSDAGKYDRSSVGIDLFFVYLKNNGTVLSKHGLTSADMFYEMYFKNDKMSFETWKNIIVNTETDAYQTMFYQDDDGQTVDANAFVFKISTVNNNGIGVIVSNKEHFLKGIKKIEWRDLCDIYIYNTAGDLVLCERKTDSGAVPQTIEQMNMSMNKDDKAYYSNIMVNRYAWRIVTVMHRGWLGKMMFITRLAAIGMVVLCLLLLAFIVRYLLKLNYKPVKSIMELFGNKQKCNEYEKIYCFINNILDENKHLVKDKNAHLSAFKHMILSELVRGTSVETDLEKYGIDFQSDYCCILLFYLEDISELFADDRSVSEAERREELEFIIENVFAELFDTAGITVYTISIDNYVVCLVNPPENGSEEKIFAVAGEGTDFINKEFDINLIYVISDMIEGVQNIADAYFQAADAIANKLLLGISEPVSAEEISLMSERADSGILSLHEEQRLIGNIQIGNTNAAVMLIKQMIERLKNDGRFSADYINTAIMHIYISIINGVRDIAEERFLSELEMKFYKNIKRDRGTADDKMYIRLINDVELICSSIKSERDTKKNSKSKTQLLVERVKEYINKNYANSNMSVMSIADEFNITASYISKQFKDTVNMSMLDYINYLRIRKALEMVKNGEHTYREIYLQVGYTNERTFYRMLKKFSE